jgi:hypothetical protein
MLKRNIRFVPEFNLFNNLFKEYEMVKVRRLLLTVAVCLLLVGLIGCDPTQTSSQRIAAVQAAVLNAQSVSAQVDISVDGLKNTIAGLELSLADPNIPAELKPKIVQTLALARAKLDALLIQKQKVDTVLTQANVILSAVDVNNANAGTEMQIIGQMMSAAANQVPPPYSGYVYLGGALLAVFGGAIGSALKASQKNKILDTYKTVLTDTVTSVKELLDPANQVIPPEKTQAATDVLKENQLPVTRRMVDAVLDPMQNTGPVNVAA